jgi:hypothetical protein
MNDIRFPGVAVYPHVTGQQWCEQCDLPLDICRGHDDNTMCAPPVDVTAMAQQIAALPVQTLVELAAAIAAIDAPTADRLADMLLDAIMPNVPAMMPSERYAEALAAQMSASDDLST